MITPKKKVTETPQRRRRICACAVDINFLILVTTERTLA